jgi:hypothetical protein
VDVIPSLFRIIIGFCLDFCLLSLLGLNFHLGCLFLLSLVCIFHTGNFP